jgi:hypothetical protein
VEAALPVSAHHEEPDLRRQTIPATTATARMIQTTR